MKGRSTLAPAAIALVLFANPAWAEAGISAAEARAWKPDVKSARAYASQRAGTVSFTVVDMFGRHYHRRNGEAARAASTFKVMLMTAYLRQRGVRDRDLTGADKDLITPMIRASDNETATRIRDMLGRPPIERLASRARMRDFRWDPIWGNCTTSARDQADFLRDLSKYVPARHWPFARRQLRRIVERQRWGIGEVRPDGWDLLFKGGWGSNTGLVDHQVAQLRLDERRVGLAILTEGNPDHAYGKQTLKGVAQRLLRGLPR